jgi:TRAP-type mannitol/chloroaromatic compound transport system substrate-binding protein
MGDDRRRGGLSNREALVAVVIALCVGLLGSLALRTPSSKVSTDAAETGLQPMRWRLPVAFGTNLPAHGYNALYMAERLEASSAGAMRFEVYEPGELVPAFSITEAVRDGKVPAGYTWLGYDQGKISWAALFGAVPFGMEPWEYIAWWYYGGGRELGEELYGDYGFHPVLCGIIGPESAGWFREELQSLDDIAGLKIRFAGIGGKVLQRLNASVTMLPGGEIFQALEKGAIDATEFSMPAIDQRLGFHRIVSYNYFPGWHQPFTAFHLAVNPEKWRELTAAQRAMIETVCTAGVANNLAKGEALQGAVLSSAPEKGIELRSLPEPLLRELQRISREVMDEEAAINESFSRVYESQKTFSAEYAIWKSLGFLPRDF